MTQAFNLAQLANNLNTSGQVDATDGLSGLVANSNLASSGTASSSTFLAGDRTWKTIPQNFLQMGICVETRQTFFSLGSLTYVSLTGLQVTLTAQSNSSIILLDTVLHHTGSDVSYNWMGRFRYVYTVNGGAEQILQSPQTASTISGIAATGVSLNSPTFQNMIAGGYYIPSSAYNAGDVVVVTVQSMGATSSYTNFYINRANDPSNASYGTNTTSFIRAWEVLSSSTTLNT